MKVVDLKRRKRSKRAPRDLVSLDKATGAARFFDRMVREIENDLGGRRQLSRIEGDSSASLAPRPRCNTSTCRWRSAKAAILILRGMRRLPAMLRIGSRLGLARRPRDVTLTLGQVLRRGADND